MKIILKEKAPALVNWSSIPSPVGKLLVGATEAGEICRISFVRKEKIEDVLSRWKTVWPKTRFIKKSGVTSLSGKDVVVVGTSFQHAVWKEMTKIPSGRSLTYGDLAKRIGKPQASRAVGSACGANPVVYLVPCHRVVGANGRLGGFSSGLDIKRELLGLEGYVHAK